MPPQTRTSMKSPPGAPSQPSGAHAAAVPQQKRSLGKEAAPLPPFCFRWAFRPWGRDAGPCPAAAAGAPLKHIFAAPSHRCALPSAGRATAARRPRHSWTPPGPRCSTPRRTRSTPAVSRAAACARRAAPEPACQNVAATCLHPGQYCPARRIPGCAPHALPCTPPPQATPPPPPPLPPSLRSCWETRSSPWALSIPTFPPAPSPRSRT